MMQASRLELQGKRKSNDGRAPARDGDMGASGRCRIGAAWPFGLLLGALALLTTGCYLYKPGPRYRTPEVPLAPQWRDAADKRLAGQPPAPAEWWKTFQDPVLDSLVQKAFKQNLTVQAAVMRLVQARARSRAALLLDPPILPLITLNASAVHSHFSRNVKPDVTISKKPGDLPPILAGKVPKVVMADHIDVYGGSADAVLPLDAWGQVPLAIEGTGADEEATVALLDDVLVALVSDVAMTYIEIRTLAQRLDATRGNIAEQEKILKTAQDRSKKGEPSEVDAQLALTLLRSSQSRIPALEAVLRRTENRLSVLLGEHPGDLRATLGGSKAIPVAPADVAMGIPADLLRRRPDVRRAERTAATECARLRLDKTKLFPVFALIGSVGAKSSDSSTLFDSGSGTSLFGMAATWSYLVYPLLIQAIRVQDARFQEVIANYKDTVLSACRDVEDAATTYLKAHEQVPLRTESAEASKRALEVAMSQYEKGGMAFSEILQAAVYRMAEEDAAIEARGAVPASLVATYRALGGGWEIRRGQNLVPDDVRREMRRRTDWWSFWGLDILSTKSVK